jgi:bifunctional non-homologous end joining protein LigD
MYRKHFVIHEHHATRLHFDLRLEMAGVLKSWAVPKGPSLNPADKRLAVMVPDHSLSYGKFEGTLAEGTYGAGEVRIWDDGKYETKIDPIIQLEKGRIDLEFFGLKLRGAFVLTRSSRDKTNWLLIKRNDHFVDTDWVLETVLPVKVKRAVAANRRKG